MAFEFDPDKSSNNEVKHGINFDKAQELWVDAARVEVPAITIDEPRTMVIGRIDGKIWAAVVTQRGEAVRIISVRRARKEEEEIYESKGI
jgi:uncharacterized DUF497 family protein